LNNKKKFLIIFRVEIRHKKLILKFKISITLFCVEFQHKLIIFNTFLRPFWMCWYGPRASYSFGEITRGN